MNKRYAKNILMFFCCIFTGLLYESNAQLTTTSGDFWSKVRFGGNLSLSFSNNRTSVVAAPSAIYQFNEKFSTGLGINFGYNNGLNFEDYIYGVSVISLYTPFRGLQLSVELEETGVTRTVETVVGDITDSYFYPSLFLGGGYQVGGVTIGVRYDVLYDEQKSIYASPFNPFFRVFF